jgi:hypothetical protein
MTKALATLATLLLAGTLGYAQAGQAGMQGGQAGMQADQGRMGQSTVRGCLSGTKGNYRLMADDGTTYKLKGQNSSLSKEVGKEVEIQTSSNVTPNASASGSMGGQSASAAASQTLQVHKVTQIADTCQNGAGMQNQSGQSGEYGGQSGPTRRHSGQPGQSGSQPPQAPTQ